MAPFGGPLCGSKSKHFGFVGLSFGGNANVQDVAALRFKHRCACCAILLFEHWLVNKKKYHQQKSKLYLLCQGA